MGLFSKSTPKKEEVKKTDAKAAPAVVNTARPSDRNLEGVILKPRITEKAVNGTDKGVYTFEIHADATKFDVRDAIKTQYDVTPAKVNIVKGKTRKYVSRSRGRIITKPAVKKAYVYLKDGDKIDLV